MARAKRNSDFDSDPMKFASLIAHQLQSPLNAVNLALQSLLEEYAGPLLPKQRASLERASARCDQAVTAMRRMLAIFRAGLDQGVRPAPAHLAGVVRQIHSAYVAEANRATIALQIVIGDEPVYVGIGEPALAEALSALLSNALKYTPEHGQVRLQTRPGAREGFVGVTVADSGVGVPEKDRDRIFEPFYRTAAARESSRPGIGLGLAFVRSVVSAAGGTVEVRKADLGGAEFVLELPVA
jgi:signal transduction histidine kinase